MTDRFTPFIHTTFTNPDRTPEQQQAIFEKAAALLESFQKAPLRVSAFEPLVLRFHYLCCEAFMNPRRNRDELIGICAETFAAARALRFSPGSAEEWIAAALRDLVRRKLLRQSVRNKQRFIEGTELGDEFMENPRQKLPPFQSGGPLTTKIKHAESPDAPEKSESSKKPKKRAPNVVPAGAWFPVAVNLLNDGLSDAEIARRVGVSRSTLSESPRWRNAKKLYARTKAIVTQFEKRGGKRAPLHRKW